MYSLVREQSYKPFALKCPWLGEIGLAVHQRAVSYWNCLALLNFLVSVSPFCLPRNFSSFLLSYVSLTQALVLCPPLRKLPCDLGQLALCRPQAPICK